MLHLRDAGLYLDSISVLFRGPHNYTRIIFVALQELKYCGELNVTLIVQNYFYFVD